MSRGELDNEIARRIEAQLPNINAIRLRILGFNPDFISLGSPVGSPLTVAAVCLQDATAVLQEARYALLEAMAHLVWYREKSDPPNESLALFFGKFYADDVALRLYAAAEHTANAIINMLDLENGLSRFKKAKMSRVSSQQALVGIYLTAELPDHEITKTVLKLKNSDDWRKIREYRDEWVHNKPPIIKGLGVGYERRNRIVKSEGATHISIGSGDSPSYSVDELLGIAKLAMSELTKVTEHLVGYYAKLLEEHYPPVV